MMSTYTPELHCPGCAHSVIKAHRAAKHHRATIRLECLIGAKPAQAPCKWRREANHTFEGLSA